jgi:hypothetical protein
MADSAAWEGNPVSAVGKRGNATRDPRKRVSPPLSLPELEVFLTASHPGSTGGPAIIAAYRRGTRFYRPGSL